MAWDGLQQEILAEFARLSPPPMTSALSEGLVVRDSDRRGQRVRTLTCTHAGCSERRRQGRGERYCDAHRGTHPGRRARAPSPVLVHAPLVRTTCTVCALPIVSDVFHLKCEWCRR
jgi:hypothetical protein